MHQVESASHIHHPLAVYDGSAAARRALAEAASLTAEHDAALTVVTLVVHERQAVGCCLPPATWNRELDAIVDEQLAEARASLGSYGRSAHFAAVEGDGAAPAPCTRPRRRPAVISCWFQPADSVLSAWPAAAGAGCARVIAVRLRDAPDVGRRTENVPRGSHVTCSPGPRGIPGRD